MADVVLDKIKELLAKDKPQAEEKHVIEMRVQSIIDDGKAVYVKFELDQKIKPILMRILTKSKEANRPIPINLEAN